MQPESISDVKVVAQARNGQETVTMFRQHQPDVTLMDWRMSVMDGVGAIAAICAEFPSARIVLLTESIQDTSPRIHSFADSGRRNKKRVSEKLAPRIYPWGQGFNLKSKI